MTMELERRGHADSKMCDRVPVLLFTRPYAPRRRWTTYGEIYLANPPPADEIPQWPMNMFADDTELPGRDLLKRTSPQLSPNVNLLCQFNIISIELDGEYLFFQMNNSIREEIWEQTSTHDRLLLWFDLLKLIIHSVPDTYAEIFWQNILRSCKPVIDSTLLPFLSVLEWTHVQHHQPLIPRLLSFLLHYSIFSGFSVDTCIYLAPGPLRQIESSGNLLTKRMIKLLKWKESLCRQLLQPQDKDRKCLDVLEGTSLETEELNGILGFLVASVLKSSKQTLQHMDWILTIVQGWRERQGLLCPTMVAFARHLLSMDGPSNRSWMLAYALIKADLHVKFTLAMAMIEYDSFAQACSLLVACAKDLRSRNFVYVNEYFLVMTELVKCYNILNKEEQGEATALEALQHSYSGTATPNQITYIRIALADSLIGRSKYSEANELLEAILTSVSLSPYLMTVASLRLNKVRRRLGVLNISAFSHNGALREALTYVNNSNDHTRDEVLEELSCTISYTQQRKTENTAAAKAVIDHASTIVAKQPMSTSTWRTRILHEQLAFESKHRKQREQSNHRNLPKRSRDAKILAMKCRRIARSLTELHKLYKGADFPDSMIQMTKSLTTFQLACHRIQGLSQDSTLTDNTDLGERLNETIEIVGRSLDDLERDLLSYRSRPRFGIGLLSAPDESWWQNYHHRIRDQAHAMTCIMLEIPVPVSSQQATTNLSQQLKEHSKKYDQSVASISTWSLSSTDRLDDGNNIWSDGIDDLPRFGFENELFASRVYKERGRSS